MLITNRVLKTNQSYALDTIIQDFERSLQANGGSEAFREEHFCHLVTWSEQKGLFFEGLEPNKEGGNEHDVTFAGDTWFKFTKPSEAAYVVDPSDLPDQLWKGLPLGYLNRLHLQNQIFKDNIRFIGVGGTRKWPRIITSQPDVKGRAANAEEIHHLMSCLEFKQIPYELGNLNSLSYLRDNVAVFDMHPRNVFRTREGYCMTIDCIPVVFEDAIVKQLLD